jgi:hypothetical protein
MIFADLHWLDPTSRELLDLTVEKITALPVFLVSTYRLERLSASEVCFGSIASFWPRRRQVCSPSNSGLARSAVDLALPDMIQASQSGASIHAL